MASNLDTLLANKISSAVLLTIVCSIADTLELVLSVIDTNSDRKASVFLLEL